MVVLLNIREELTKGMKNYKCEKYIVLCFVKEGVKKISGYEEYKNNRGVYADIEFFVDTYYSKNALPSTNALLLLIQIEQHVKMCENYKKNRM